jgi:glutathione S-transferase
MTDLTLYDYAASANCLKVRVLLAQLGRAYRRVPVDIFAGDTRSPEYLGRNPLARTPVLELADGTAIFESAAILLYLAESTAMLPADPLARARVHQWLFVEQNDVEPNLGRARFWRLTGRDALEPEVFANCVARGEAAVDGLEAHLASGRSWVAGDGYTVADLALWAYVHLADDAGVSLASRPAVRAWVARVEGTPGFVDDLEPYPENALPGRGSRPER